MNQNLNQLYQQKLLEHHKHPVGFQVKLEQNVLSAEGENPACGDEIHVAVDITDGAINGLSFSGDSCAICRASASMMCSNLASKSIELALMSVENIQKSFAEQRPLVAELAPLNSVTTMPIRQQCALLPWSTLALAINQYSDTICKKTG